MKIRYEYVFLFLGLLANVTLVLIEPPLITLIKIDGEYYDIRSWTPLTDIDEEWIVEEAGVSIDGGPHSGSYTSYNYVTISGRLAIMLLLGTFLVVTITWIIQRSRMQAS